MIPSQFDYHAPTTLAEAVALLSRFGEGAKVLSGGQSLLPLLKLRLGTAEHLVDIGRIPGLEYIKEEGGVLKIGGRTRESALEQSELVKAKALILHDTARVIADPLVRNWATVGGNLAHADPGNNHPATMLALGASVVAVGPDGERIIPVDEFFTGSSFETTLRPNEILTEIRVPGPTDQSGGAYFQLERKVGDYAIAGVAAYVRLNNAGQITYAGIGLTNVGPTPIKARNAEQFWLGKALDEASIHQAADLAATAAQPSSDTRGPAEYKRAMVRTLAVRALRKASARARGGE